MGQEEPAAAQPGLQRPRLRLPGEHAIGVARRHGAHPILAVLHRAEQVFFNGLNLPPLPARLRIGTALQRREDTFGRLQRAGQGVPRHPGGRHGAGLGGQFTQSPVLCHDRQRTAPGDNQHHRPCHTAQKQEDPAGPIRIRPVAPWRGARPALSLPSPWPAQWPLSRMPNIHMQLMQKPVIRYRDAACI